MDRRCHSDWFIYLITCFMTLESALQSEAQLPLISHALGKTFDDAAGLQVQVALTSGVYSAIQTITGMSSPETNACILTAQGSYTLSSTGSSQRRQVLQPYW